MSLLFCMVSHTVDTHVPFNKEFFSSGASFFSTKSQQRSLLNIDHSLKQYCLGKYSNYFKSLLTCSFPLVITLKAPFASKIKFMNIVCEYWVLKW